MTRLLQVLGACEPMDTDRYGRMVARCYTLEGEDIGALLVAAGVAWDYGRYSGGCYADQEVGARAAGRGNWGMECVTAWEWRRGN